MSDHESAWMGMFDSRQEAEEMLECLAEQRPCEDYYAVNLLTGKMVETKDLARSPHRRGAVPSRHEPIAN